MAAHYLLATLTLLYWQASQSHAMIKCYCNAPECIDTGHVCNSYTEKCFSSTDTKNSSSIHGCIELLPEQDQLSCEGKADVVKQLDVDGTRLILCCSEELCNYRQNQDIDVDIVNTNSEQGFEIYTKPEPVNKKEELQTSEDNVWFKAAVIAVPIAGGFILVVLILMAVRLLRDDHNQSERQKSLAKAQGFIDHHFVNDSPYTHSELLNNQICEKQLAKRDQYKSSSKPERHWKESLDCSQATSNDCDDKSSSLLMWNEENSRLSFASVV